MLVLELLSELLCWCLGVCVVDRDVTTLRGKFASDLCTQSPSCTLVTCQCGALMVPKFTATVAVAGAMRLYAPRTTSHQHIATFEMIRHRCTQVVDYLSVSARMSSSSSCVRMCSLHYKSRHNPALGPSNVRGLWKFAECGKWRAYVYGIHNVENMSWKLLRAQRVQCSQ